MNTEAAAHVSDKGLFKLRVATPAQPKPTDVKTTQGEDSSVRQGGY